MSVTRLNAANELVWSVTHVYADTHRQMQHMLLTMPMSSFVCRSISLRWLPNTSNICSKPHVCIFKALLPRNNTSTAFVCMYCVCMLPQTGALIVVWLKATSSCPKIEGTLAGTRHSRRNKHVILCCQAHGAKKTKNATERTN